MSIYWLKKYDFQSGENHKQWKGGRLNSNGYVYIYCPNHPYAKWGRKKYVAEHRLVMEKKIGRYLYKNEIVHHINGIRNDNKESNLIIIQGHSKHITDHNRKRVWKKESREKHRIKVGKFKRDDNGRFCGYKLK